MVWASSRNLLGNSDKDPERSSTVRTHWGICLGTARRTLDFPLQSELIEESVGEQREGSWYVHLQSKLIEKSVGEQREGPWTFLYSQNSLRNLLGNSEKDPGLSSTVRTHREICWGTQEGPWTFLYRQDSSRNLLGSSEKDPGLSSTVSRTHWGICWGTPRRALGFPLKSELIEESVGEHREGSWTFLYSQNSSRNLLGKRKKDPGLSCKVRTRRGICWGTARRTLDFPL